MRAEGRRAHGVTPGLSRDYSTRTAGRQAAFVLPYLHPGMHLLDVGCGPGSITLGAT
jgi:ubiquinone/menaquinone biosynthesis C-methylase UbiE